MADTNRAESCLRSDHAIEAYGISKTYGGGRVAALTDVTFKIGWGKVFAYLGRNGSGKTTTVRVLTTLTPLTAGSAKVAGCDVRNQATAVRRTVGVGLQDAALDPVMTGTEHLHLVGQLLGNRHRESRQRAIELLEAFGLAGAGRIATYSGGMRRRLDLATALFNQPPILFLDEPTTGLDPQSRRAVWSVIRRSSDDGAVVFLTTQYIEEADRLADEVAIVKGGRLVASGTKSELKHKLGGTTVKLRVPAVRKSEAFQLFEDKVTTAEDGWIRFANGPSPVTSSEVLARMLARLSKRGIPVEALSVSEPSLEDIFIALTKEANDHQDGGEGRNGGTGGSASDSRQRRGLLKGRAR